jgi:hypothetical protein
MLLCVEIGLPSILTGSPSQGKVRQQDPRRASGCLTRNGYPWLVVLNPRQYSWRLNLSYLRKTPDSTRFRRCIPQNKVISLSWWPPPTTSIKIGNRQARIRFGIGK